ncbi:MAG: type II secretion system protein [Candidatus Omnitrophota bacterium]
MWKAKRKFNSGFTLIELMVVASILVILTIAVSSAFLAGLNVYNRARSFAAGQADILLAFEKMERNFKNSVSIFGKKYVFEGKKLSFPIITREVDTKGKENIVLSEVVYYFDYQQKAILEQYQNSLEARKLASAEDLAFSYCSFNPVNRKCVWGSFPGDGLTLPRGVKIKIIFKDNTGIGVLERTVFMPVGG